MTKLRGGPELLAPPATAYLPSARGHRDHHLDFSSTQPLPRDAHPTHYKSNIACDSPGQRWHSASTPQPEVGARLQNLAHDQLTRGTMPMEKVVPRDPGSCYMPALPITADPPSKRSEQTAAQKPFSKNGNAGGKKKKNYQRYPKPPYSYLAMIAMVIQNSPEKKLTLSEILKEISSLFPFFKGNYKGWRDSVRHNLSSYDCFVKVLKDPGKPQGKGNFWAVEVSRVPLELLKRQNTAVSRQDETIFAQDLAPYILQGHTPVHKPDLPPPSAPPTVQGPAPPDDPHRPKLDSSFAIDSLLHSFRPASTAGEGLRGKDSWGVEPPHNHLVSPLHPRHPSSNHSASASSASPASSSSDEEWRGLARAGKRVSDGEAGPDGYDHSCPPPNKTVRRGSAPPWELPTSYAKYTPPNAVAPPSMRFGGGPFVPLGGIPFYSYSSPHVTPSHFSTHGYWPLLPSRHVSLQAPPLLMDLDRMLQSVPPNKSVFDVLGAVNQTVHSSADQHPLQHTPSFSKYS